MATVKNNSKIYSKRNKTYKKSRSRKGGEVIASGGFGCIFKPALKCISSNSRKSGVSKMSIQRHGVQEMNEIVKIREKLKKIKNYNKYYLLDITMCKPDTLNVNDLKNFDEKCYAITRYNINKKNVNNNLDKLTILNMPNAGIDLKDWIIKDKFITKDKIIQLNKLIISLLKHGVIPMNKRNVIHNDLKDRNIMIDDNLNARIIDWGLASIVNNNKIPNEIMDRPLQFNTPFSSMIISEEFIRNYNSFLHHVKKGTILFNHINLRNYIINEYLTKINRYYGYYDDNVIVFNMLFSSNISAKTFLSDEKKEALLEYGYYLYYLSNYITDILIKYTTSNYDFLVDKYFSECYLFNSDIFGLMTVYYNFFEIDITMIQLPDEIKRKFLNRIKSMLVDHIYSNGDMRINVKKIINCITELNNIVSISSNNNNKNKSKKTNKSKILNKKINKHTYRRKINKSRKR